MHLRYFLAYPVALLTTLIWIFQATAGPVNSAVQALKGRPSSAEVLTLNQALSLAFSRNPDLLASLIEIKAREALVLQSRLLPNPEFNLEFENFYGNKEFRRFDAAESTVTLSQPILLGGKISKRVELAARELELSEWDYRAKRLDLVAEVSKAFIDVVIEQDRLALTEELVRLAEEAFRTASARVQAGKVSPIDETKASATLSLTRIEVERAKRSLEAARKRLSATWGSPLADFKKVEGRLDIDPSIPTYEDLSSRVPINPDIARWDDEIERRKAALKVERAARFPDIVLSGGIRRLNETHASAFIMGMTIPLPIFNRNQGGILEAEKRLSKAGEEKKAAILKAQTALSETYQALSTSFLEAKTLRDSVLPALQSAYDAVHEGYSYGKLGYLDVLDTQRTLFESKVKYVETLAAYQKSKADVQRLTGAFLMNDTKEKVE